MKQLTTTLLFLLFSSTSFAQSDAALSVIEKTTEENREKNLPPEVKKSGFAISGEFGVPHPLKYNLEYFSPSSNWSGFVSFGSLGFDISQADLNLSYSEIGARWHVRQGALFVGAALGKHTIKAKQTDTFAGQPTTIEAEVEASYVKPMAGWIWKKQNSRLYWGLELGVMIPMSDDYTFATSLDLTGTPEYDDAVQEVEDVADLLGRTTLVSIGMVRVGWEF